MLLGEPTGAVYRWSPGESGFTLIPGTELPGNNGIEVARDDSGFYVASSGLGTVVAYSATANPAQPLRTTEQMSFLPDNVHLTSSGLLISAGTIRVEPECDEGSTPENFDLEVYAACPRRLVAATIDTRSMDHAEVVSESKNYGEKRAKSGRRGDIFLLLTGWLNVAESRSRSVGEKFADNELSS